MAEQNNIGSAIGQALQMANLSEVAPIRAANLARMRAIIIRERHHGDEAAYMKWRDAAFASSEPFNEAAEYEWLSAQTISIPTEYGGIIYPG